MLTHERIAIVSKRCHHERPRVQSKRQTCLSSSGVFCGGIEGTLLTIPLACISYSLDTLLALEYSLLLSSIIFLAIIGLILYNTHSHLLTAIKELSL